MNKKKLELSNDYYIFECPHCNDYIIVHKNELNCRIFRHAVYKINNEQINPHSSKDICDKLFNEDLIYGCAKPFQILSYDDSYYAEICDYI